MPAGSTMARIRPTPPARGRRLGRHPAARLPQPVHRRIEGFDIDMLHATSQAIFGDPNKIELKVITAAQRMPVFRMATSTSWPAT